MMSKNFLECRTLPAINETFPQFNRPPISLLSPLDLSLRASNSIPITPPSTPSPPRKRQRLMSDENYLWRPHVMETAAEDGRGYDSVRIASETSNYLNNLTYSSVGELGVSKSSSRSNNSNNTNNNSLECNNLSEIPESQVRELPQQQQQQLIDMDTIYVDDETILLTEDEDETLVSSHDYTEDAEEDDIDDAEAHAIDHEKDDDDDNDEHQREEDEDEYVDVLGNDDDDDADISHTTMLRLQSETENNLEDYPRKVLTRNELIYEDEELHNQAVDGMAKLFDRDFQQKPANDEKTERTYVDLTTGLSIRETDGTKKTEQLFKPQQQQQQQQMQQKTLLSTRGCNHPKTYKTGERKRMKLRKNLSLLDEDTISPVSGTIIRKLRDDEELVVRKGDIDPAFNVVEITEEAKAILASIDNKIGEYLCRLCRTLYDDAFQLAQHRCPRIVHIEYKCSECEKVFNCPANLASHRRWHKPKSELLAKGQAKKRPPVEATATSSNVTHEKQGTNDFQNDNADGIFPCQQCGKSFRRHAYLKKHQASHQMMENLKSLDIFKSSIGNYRNEVPYQPNVFRPTNLSTSLSSQQTARSAHQANLPTHTTFYQHQNKNSSHQTTKLYPQRFGTLPFPSFHHDQRRFYSLEDFYLSQHFERSSAFQYVQATTHLRNLSTSNATTASATVGSSFLSRTAAIPSLNSLVVK